GMGLGGVAPALKPAGAAAPQKVESFARQAGDRNGELAKRRGLYEEERLAQELKEKGGKGDKAMRAALEGAVQKKEAQDLALRYLARRDREGVQTGKLGVDLSVQTNNLRSQSRLEATAQQQVAGRNVLEFGGVWIDEDFTSKTPAVTVKAMSQ